MNFDFDADPAFHSAVDPDPAFHSAADPDPASPNDADPDQRHWNKVFIFAIFMASGFGSVPGIINANPYPGPVEPNM
jgi:hypothetical protein